ncbi:MAG: U32 family peptidase [Acetatifactor sp.]|nr:U32 family peptidase [Acetatifactor sp.]
MDRRVELLAPAGNLEGFYGAIHAGADAVYLGGERFGARAYADNFTSEELLVCIKYAHIWGRRVYLTVNTLVKEAEFAELFPFLQPLYEAGLDGVIVQDIGAFALIREHFPDMELHVSTQMTLTGRYGAKLLKQMGAVRIVPARELSLVQIQEIKESAGLQVETFIHGAMCYCYSGQCLFSSILGGRSGNRGRCAQPCRLPYRVEREGHAGQESYLLSLKDMCTVEHLSEFISAGIDSFKIEGRMKRPEYAAGVTAIYRKYIDKVYQGEGGLVAKEDLAALRTLYIRSELQDGYYYRHNGRDMVTLTSPSYSGNDEDLLARIRARYLEERPRISLKLQAKFCVGQPACLTVAIAESGIDEIQISVTGDEVSAALKRPIDEENIHRQLGKMGDTVFCVEEMEITLDENAFYPLKSLNELRRHAIEELENLLILRNGLPVSRQIKCVPEHRDAATTEKVSVPGKSSGQFHVLCRTAQQLNALLELLHHHQTDMVLPRRVYLDAELCYQMHEADRQLLWEQFKAFCKDDRFEAAGISGIKIIIALPSIIRSNDIPFLEKIWTIYLQDKDVIQGFLARSMDGLGYLKEMIGKHEAKPAIYTDAGLYVWNHGSLRCIRELCRVDNDTNEKSDQDSLLEGFCLPYELRAAEQRQLLEKCAVPCEKIVYGRIPLMVTANCIANTTEGCQKSKPDEVSFLIDRYQKRFPVLRNCRHCMNIIYNSLPLSLHAGLSKWRESVDFRLDFTIEDAGETTRILRYFLSDAKGDLPYTEYTTGHEKRGVE